MTYASNLRSKLDDMIVDVSMNPQFYKNSLVDFTRTRKLPFSSLFYLILSIGGNSIDHELLESFDFKQDTPTSSAFVQARGKILPAAFSSVFHSFSKSLPVRKKFRGYQLLAVDGSNINIFHNPHDPETYVQYHDYKGHNALLLSCMYDLLNNIYTDAVIQPIKLADERGALIEMLPNISKNNIIIADRGYESYNIFAHFESVNSRYVVRVKDIHSNGILSGFDLPNTEFDKCITVNISNFNRKKYQTLPNLKYSPSIARFDFSTHTDPIYTMTLRVVRVKLHSGKYESIITDLSSEFSSDDIKELYHLRWGIETSFRQLKYAVGLTNFHAKKKDSIVQEIYANLILHNFCESIVQNGIHSQPTKHNYIINFTRAVQICRKFLNTSNTAFFDIEVLINKYLSMVRKDRAFKRSIRKKGYISFVYRVA